MKKNFTIKNIHCADCARSLEEVISGLRGVVQAKINFVTEKFDLEIEDASFEETFTKIKKIIRDFSKNVVLYENVGDGNETKGENQTIKFKIVGLTCPNCAGKITASIEKLKEVKSANMNFTLGEMNVRLNHESTEAIVAKIKSLIHTIEPKLKIKTINEKENKKFNFQLFFFFVGLVLSIPIFLCEYNVIKLPTWGYYLILFASAFAFGYNTYITAIKMLFHGNINENLLLTISVFGAIAIGENAEGLMVVGLYALGKMLEAKAVNRSRKSIKNLLEISPEYAVVIRNGEEHKVSPTEVVVGETIIVRPGEKVALDGKILVGHANINAQSLTGEAMPIPKTVGQEILSGVIVLDGVLEIEVIRPLKESTTTKIMELIEKASENKSKTETFISKFAKYYTLIVIGLSLVVGALTGLILKDINTAIYRALIFLVISCPCAFAISVPLTYFSGIGNASQKGILIKGSNHLDASAKAKVVAFDKTGTLTTGEFKIGRVEVLEDIYTEDEILEIAGSGEQYSIHPLGICLKNALKKPAQIIENYKEIAGLGIQFELDGTEYFVGKDETFESLTETMVVVKKGNITLGRIYFEDSIKPTSPLACKNLNEIGIKTVILSGDNQEVAIKTGKEIGVDEVYAELLPQDKYNWIDEKRKSLVSGERLIYVGDGINDAPSLALADVGVSMGLHGSGASIEASDVVLVDDDPAKLAELIKTAKYTKKIVVQNIAFASIIKLTCLILGTIGIAKMFMAVFADVGVTVLAVLNSIRALKFNSKKNR